MVRPEYLWMCLMTEKAARKMVCLDTVLWGMEMSKSKNDFELRFCSGRKEAEHTVLDINLIYILSGHMDVQAGTEKFCAKSGDFFVLNVGQNFSWESDEDCLYARLTMSYGLFVERLGTSYIYLMCNTVRGDMDEDIRQKLSAVLSQMIREYTSASETSGFRREYLWYRLMDVLVRNFMFHAPASVEIMENEQRMILAIQYICANYAADLPQDEAAKKMYLSTSAFSRWFKKQTGINYGEFVTQVRLAHSTQDLLCTDQSITDIAVDNGFSNSSVFTKVFRKKYGMTPTQYRKSYNETGDEDGDLIPKVEASEEYKRRQTDIPIQKVRVVQADTREGALWENGWDKAINGGEAADLLSARIQNQILDLKEAFDFKYIRISNIFSNRLRLRKNHSVAQLNFDSLDGILDFIVSHGMHPFIDLCDREHLVFLAMNEFLYKDQAEGAFLSKDEMISVVTAMFRHFVNRYGIKEVSSWPIECWYNDRQDQVMGLSENYGEIFKNISALLKEIVPGIRVGGCGLELGISEVFFREVLQKLNEAHCVPDFITIYIYPYADVYSQISDFDYTSEKLRLCRNIMKQYHMEHLDIYVTEWNLSVSARNYYNDSCAKASMMLRHAVSSMGQGQMFMYSMVSDLFTNYYDSSKMLFGAPGLLSKDGLYKPVYYGLWFLHCLSGRVLSSGPEHLITVSDTGVYNILMFCPKALNYKYFLKKEYDIQPSDLKEMFEDDARILLNIEISNVDGREYYERRYTLDIQNGSLMDQWMEMGMPEVLSMKDMEYLKGVAQPKIIFCKMTAMDQRLYLRETLDPHQIKFIQIYPK